MTNIKWFKIFRRVLSCTIFFSQRISFTKKVQAKVAWTFFLFIRLLEIFEIVFYWITSFSSIYVFINHCCSIDYTSKRCSDFQVNFRKTSIIDVLFLIFIFLFDKFGVIYFWRIIIIISESLNEKTVNVIVYFQFSPFWFLIFILTFLKTV